MMTGSAETGALQGLRLVFWQNHQSIHQAPLLRAAATLWRRRTGGDVQLNVMEPVPDHRRESGWRDFDYGAVRVVRVENRDGAFAEKSFDVFSGFPIEPRLVRRARAMARVGRRFAVLAERPGDEARWKAPVRAVKYRLASLRLPTDFLLFPLGADAEAFYRAVGFDGAAIRPFGYFPEHLGPSRDRTQRNGFERVALLFVGSLDRRKAPDLLLRALRDVADLPWRLSIVGTGPLRPALEQLAETPELRGKVKLHGAMANSDVQSLMQEADHLLLASRYDGWGAVVNESLMAGTPVLISRHVGARSLLVDDKLGRVVPIADQASMAEALREVIEQGPVTGARKEAIAAWACEKLAPENAADYLLNAITTYLTGERPPENFFRAMGEP